MSGSALGFLFLGLLGLGLPLVTVTAGSPLRIPATPPELRPQQTTERLVRTPHECQPPAETAVNEPDGGVTCPAPLLPQHTTEPSAPSAHECEVPAETAVNEPDGGVTCPDSLLPQHTTEPLVRSAHECQPPAETAVNEPAGGVVSGGGSFSVGSGCVPSTAGLVPFAGGGGATPRPETLCHNPTTYTAICARVTDPSSPPSALDGITPPTKAELAPNAATVTTGSIYTVRGILVT